MRVQEFVSYMQTVNIQRPCGKNDEKLMLHILQTFDTGFYIFTVIL